MERTVKRLPVKERFCLLVNHVVRLLGLERFFRKKELWSPIAAPVSKKLPKSVEVPKSEPAKAYRTPLATSPGPEGVTTRHSMENT